ncbi:MAG: hypothetical protein KDC87_17545 [Planctomycetes bacterium]|nr:hypothetical protein [Planctomycetota bacterium]MCB9870352.1 hypothetical protein [Planctomycetota bacterium]MCB9888072.1 hypothetical protein [Planctomycetota bacterium]
MHRYLIPLLLSSSLFAADIVVGPTGSIQAAIDSAQPNDRILVQPGTYFELIDFRGKNLTVVGVGGAAVTILDGGVTGPVVRFANGEGPGAVLQGFTIRNGASSTGTGGLVASGATPTVLDCIITANHGKFGGGVSGTPTLRRCSVFGNSAGVSNGGGIYGAPQLYHCVIAQNTCSRGSGGGLYLTGGTSVVEDCVLVENSVVLTGRRGGGVFVNTSATATLRRCVIANNFVASGNYPAAGGGVCSATANTLVDSCTIFGNRLTTNSSTNGGGWWGPGTLTNSVVRGDTAPEVDGSPTAVTYCNVQGGYAGTGNIDADPRFVAPSTGDFHLDFGSPDIDAGDPARKDPDGSRVDIGAFPFQTLYTRANTRKADWSQPSWAEISALVGGRQVMRVLAGAAQANQNYLGAGSLSGTTPGLMLGGVLVPLNPDVYFDLTLANPNSSWLPGSRGTLDAAGTAELGFVLAPGLATVNGSVVVHHAVAVLGTVTPLRAATNALALTVVR